ncbi:GNAT family N-acetyltransferase [Acinetobacter pittii]|uniref:GNAT family N-acetyltransferase n=1 Tax=Acinetobacter pittii TaxID=48296 RepID=UPI0008380D15|nr:GNAT family N-acetyltransferase [Acinetobacter pittii]OCY54995.1 hypothetical protein BFR81_00010 [Acinetobacter pittii]ODL99085.1 hypothetical protein AXH23_17745 [Acinetobacter pittii]PPB97528.1 GNAT family N-acetyltransferase [Acinetobacter pittii]QID24174.1 GNAT family N-acetyltransferase [Acinetobacter pittii]WPP79144.1 GNAT family N-acetyltransferase [Acinetobacter pittii]
MIQPLTQDYDNLTECQKESRKNFKSSDSWVNTHLQSQFGQQNSKGLAKGFTMLDATDTQIIGCYSITPIDVQFNLTKEEVKQIGLVKGVPITRPLPAYLIVSLGIDQNFEGRGLGKLLLIEALMRIYEICQHAGGVGVVVDTSNEKVRTFYEKYGFQKVPNTENRYFLARKELIDLFESTSEETSTEVTT